MSEAENSLPPEIPRRYGNGLLGGLVPKDARCLIVTMPAPWEIAKRQFASEPESLQFVTSLAEEEIVRTEAQIPPVDRVLGIGGGMCMDYAKYVAWKRKIPLTLAPGIVSVDACLTDAIALRRQGRVEYVGKVYPDEVVVDFDLVCAAPPELNRAGAGDILSIHTALFDWKLAHERTGETYDAVIAHSSRALLGALSKGADEIRNATPAGIRTIMELFNAEVRLCYEAGSSRPEEGSEHFWAYNLEYRTGRSFVHGNLVAVGIVLMSALQNNDVTGIRGLIDSLGIPVSVEGLGVTRAQARDALTTARAYAEAERLEYSILNDREITPALADELIAVAVSEG